METTEALKAEIAKAADKHHTVEEVDEKLASCVNLSNLALQILKRSARKPVKPRALT